jgi:hypothetical protein
VLAIENANKCSVSETELEQLLKEHDIEVAQGIFDSKDKYRKIVKAGITQWVKDFQSGHIQISTVDDLKKLIELDLQLQEDDL